MLLLAGRRPGRGGLRRSWPHAAYRRGSDSPARPAVNEALLAGDTASALALLEDSGPSEPWEQPVAACLKVLCLRSSARPAASAIHAMVEHYLKLEPVPELVVFRTRLGLTVIDLAGGINQTAAAQAATRLVAEAVAAKDGYAARELLAAHDGGRARLTGIEQRALSAAIRSAGIGGGTIPGYLMADLLAAVKTSETATAQNLTLPLPASPT